MTDIRIWTLALVVATLVGCGKEQAATTASAPAATAVNLPADQPPESATRRNPGFGGVEQVTVTVEAVGDTPEVAVLRALDMAISQVNGRRVDSAMADMEVQFRASGSQGEATLNTSTFVQALVSASKGAVTSFRVLEQQEIQRVEAERIISAQQQSAGYTIDEQSSASVEASASSSASGEASASAFAGETFGTKAKARASEEFSTNEEASFEGSERHSLKAEQGPSSSSYNDASRVYAHYWKVRVEAAVAKYVAPDEKGRPKIAIVLPRSKSDQFPVGDDLIAATEVASEIRLRLSDAITQTKRFIVLDREFGDVLDEEAAFIDSGRARSQELARIGQQMATDLLLVVSIDRFEYPRATRQLRMSDRQLISYAGGGKLSLKLINASTGEVVMSESFSHALPATAPSTMPRVIDGRQLTGQMMDAISGKMTAAVINEIFPVSVIAMQGATVVLSQGGQSVTVGNRYQAVVLGQELIDPQTGNSLGRMETPCCVVRIDRVSEQTSYGSIEGDLPQLPEAFKPGMIELRESLAAIAATAAAATSPTSTGARAQPSPVTARLGKPIPTAAPEKPAPDDDADW